MRALAPKLTANEYFEIFTAEQVLKDFDLSYDELEAGVVGDGGDGGIDGIYVFTNGELVQEDSDLSNLKKDVTVELVIIQAKTSPGFGEAAIEKLIAVTEDLLDLSHDLKDYASVYNEEVRGAVGIFRKTYKTLAARFPKLRIRYAFSSRGLEVHPNVQRKADLLGHKVKSLFSAADYSFEFLGAAMLLQLARRAPIRSYTLSLAENPISSSGDIGFISLVRLRDYFGFIADGDQIRRHLFEANVRDYQGRTQVNEDIQRTLLSPGREDFWWLNNGITIVASKATQSGKTLTLEDPQIVNGLQTSTEVFNYYRNSKNEADGRNLLVRVIVPTQSESRDRIIKATNSQTYIPPASLRATDKVQRDIEEYLRPFGLFYDRRKNFYKNEGQPLDRIVGISAMAQAVMAVALQRPDTARARPSSLLKNDADYDTVFSDSNPLDLYRVCIVLVRRVEQYQHSLETLSPKDRNNLRFYVAMHLAAILSNHPKPDLNEIVSIDLDDIKGDDVLNSVEAVYAQYIALGASDQAAKGTDLLRLVEQDLQKSFKDE